MSDEERPADEAPGEAPLDPTDDAAADPAEDEPGPAPAEDEVVETREVERKLRVPALFRTPELSGAATGVLRVEQQPAFTQTAVYYDTSDLRLARWGVTLRRREGGVDDGWHLKMPVPGAHPGDRDELQLPLDASADGDVPTAYVDLVTALTRGGALTPVATLRTDRTPSLLYGPDDVQLAELVDDVVSVLDGEVVAGRFREIEVEARAAGTEALDAIVAALLAAGAETGTTSKAAHALGPRATAPPDVPVPGPASPDDPAGDAVRAHLLTQTRRLILNDVRLRRGLPDAVHQMRVAARRLRSGLRTFRPLLEREWADELRTELAWLANELGAVRDTEVLLDRLDRHAGLLADPVLAERVRPLVDAALGERLDAATAEALASLSSPRYLALLDRAVEAAVKPWFTPVASEPGRDVLPHLARKSWRELRRDAEQLEIDGPAEIWHETRIIAKRARYAAEALEPVFGKPATALAGHLEEVTELLGEHQDAHVSRLVLREIAERPGLDGLDGFALGALRDLEDDAELEARLRFVRLWPRVVRAHRRTRIG